MTIEKEIEIHNSIEKAWKILGHDFAHPDKWASAVNHSEGRGKAIDSSQCDERTCQTVMGNLREKLTDYSDKEFRLSYILIEGMPFFVKKATNSWQLIKLDSQKAKLKIKMEFAFEGLIGWFMQPLMKIQLSKMGTRLVEDFAYYAENGIPHPRKQKALKK